MDIEQIYELYRQSYTVCTDTRKIKDNCIFFALKGDHFNGNSFAKEALKKGAAYAIIDEFAYQEDERFILVDNVLETLQKLATHHRKQLSIPILALTGSNGKTTTKELINVVLSKKYSTTATLGNLNNHIGVPLTLLSMSPQTVFGIVEMGANHLKEIEFLSAIAKPDYGYITNFGKAHLEGFGGIEGVKKGKSELYDYLREHKGMAFVNGNDAEQLQRSQGIKRFTFGDVIADVVVKMVTPYPTVTVQHENMIIESQLTGAYNFTNIAVAIAIGIYFKVPHTDIKHAIENYMPSNNRSQILQKGAIKVILDAYNANPTSMEVALENLSGIKDQKKIAILGDMFELGPESALEHQRIAEIAESKDIDKVFLIGSHFSNVKLVSSKITIYKSFEDFKAHIDNSSLENTIVLIKASRGMALERVLELL